MSFQEKLLSRIAATDSRVCLGIDPRPESHPRTHPQRWAGRPSDVAVAVEAYFADILEGAGDVLACVKLQSAFFEALGLPGIETMARLLQRASALGLPTILDAKRGDIGSTAEAYARAYLGDGPFASDALTVNPYLGLDGLQPFVAAAEQSGRGMFVLVKTSNPGSSDLQDLLLADGRRLFFATAELVARLAAGTTRDGRYSPVGAVVGATHPRELADLRLLLPHSILLVPGYGAQGGGPAEVAAAFDEAGTGAVVNSSRGLCYGLGEAVAEEALNRAQEMRDAINRALEMRQAH